MKALNSFSVRIIGAVSIVSLLGGCAAGQSDDYTTQVPSVLSDEVCQPGHRDRPGTEVVRVGIQVFDAGSNHGHSVGDTTILEARFDSKMSGDSSRSKTQKMPFERVMESAYVSGVEIVTKEMGEGEADQISTNIETSMFAVGFGGLVEIEKTDTNYLMHLKYRDAVLKGIHNVAVEGSNGEVYTVQSPDIVSRSQEVHLAFAPETGVWTQTNQGADGRQVLVQRCWYKVPEAD